MKSRLNELLDAIDDITSKGTTSVKVSQDWVQDAKSELQQLRDRRDELLAHVKVTSRAGFIAGVVWSRTDTGNKSLNTAADEFAEIDKQIQASASAAGFLAGCRYARSTPENWLELRDEIKAEQYAAGLL